MTDLPHPIDESDASVIDLYDARPMVIATVQVRGCDPGRALAAFTDPAVLARWWRGELTADLVSGGEYSINFPAIPARLTGRVLSFEPGKSLEFSWAWADDDGPASSVLITSGPGARPDSAVLRLEHGTQGDDDAARAAHREHFDGWEFFLPRLADELAGDL